MVEMTIAQARVAFILYHKKVFPSFDFNKLSFHGEACEMAKHYWTTFWSLIESSLVHKYEAHFSQDDL